MQRSFQNSAKKKAVSSIIGAILLFAMLITIGSTYFYVIAQDQKTLQNSINQNQNNFQNIQTQEKFGVYGISQSGELAFYVNNTGIGVSITSYWILNQSTGAVLEYCPSPPKVCSGSDVPVPTDNTNLPLNVAQGQSKTFNDTDLVPAIIMPATGQYVIKLVTKEGTSSIGTYPSQQLTSTSVNSLVAGGFGSLEMAFSTFSWYSYLSGPPATSILNNTSYENLCSTGTETLADCNGGTWQLDINHPHPGSLVPGGYSAPTQSLTTTTGTTTATTTSSKTLTSTTTQTSTSLTTTTTTSTHVGPASTTTITSTSSKTLTSTSTTTVTSPSTSTQTSTSTTTVTNTITQPYQTPIAFSVNITNDDPSLGTIVINSESNLWVIETCDSGVTEGNCPSGNPFFVFYVMNVNPTTGVISSTSTGSFDEIQIPYGVTKTIYYGAAYDLSLNPYSIVGLTSAVSDNPYYYGQFAVFLLFAGTKVVSANSQVYGQNIPFESTEAADNFGWYSETPVSCNPGVSTSFTLSLNDSIFANQKYGITKVVLNASAFSGVTVGTLPSHWTGSQTAGTITWTNSTDAGAITPGSSDNFQWSATAPSPTVATTYIFPLTITWDGGEVTNLQAATVCTVT